MTVQVVPNDNTWLAPTNNPSTVLEAGRVIKASAGILYGLSGYNSNVAAQNILLFDAAAVPADGATAVEVIRVPATSSFIIDFGAHGKVFNIGMSVSNSSTAPTKTIGAADCFFTPRYK